MSFLLLSVLATGDVAPDIGSFVLLPSALPNGEACFIAECTGAAWSNYIKIRWGVSENVFLVLAEEVGKGRIIGLRLGVLMLVKKSRRSVTLMSYCHVRLSL